MCTSGTAPRPQGHPRFRPDKWPWVQAELSLTKLRNGLTNFNELRPLIRRKKLGHHEHLSPDKRLQNADTVDKHREWRKLYHRHIGKNPMIPRCYLPMIPSEEMCKNLAHFAACTGVICRARGWPWGRGWKIPTREKSHVFPPNMEPRATRPLVAQGLGVEWDRNRGARCSEVREFRFFASQFFHFFQMH